MRVDRLLAIKQHILEEPLRIYMGDWVIRGRSLWARGFMVPECGTVACIWGWAVELFGETDQSSHPQAVLGITWEQQNALFFDSQWPDEFRYRLKTLKPQTPEYARVVADRIDHMIETGL